MEDYPRTLRQFEERFSTQEACLQYLRQLRWPEGFVCPGCRGQQSWEASRGRIVCGECGRQTTVTAGTIFARARHPLTLWFRAIWWVTSQKNGASALGLQRVLGLGSYETAWTWLHKLRRAMVRPGRDRLSGRVEVDETYVGPGDEGTQGRDAAGKALVAIAAQEDGQGIGRIRMARVPDASATSLLPFVSGAVETGSVIHTDGWSGYSSLDAKGYTHEATPLKGRPGAATKMLPRVHHVASLLQRWLMGTHHGAISHEHLDYYLDEFTFRFNRRTSASRGKLFYRLLQQAVQVGPVPYPSLVKNVRGPKHNG